MPLYVYEAADQSGKKVKDTLEAAGEAGVKEYLKEQGLLPLSIKEGNPIIDLICPKGGSAVYFL